MCRKLKDETWVAFFFRMFCEEPQSILAFLGFAIAVGLYMDGRALLQEMTSAYRELSKDVSEMSHSINDRMNEANIRLQDASNRVSRLEDWHRYVDMKKGQSDGNK